MVTTVSPYQAIHILKQLKKEDCPQFQFLDTTFTTQTYIDDIILDDQCIPPLFSR